MKLYTVMKRALPGVAAGVAGLGVVTGIAMVVINHAKHGHTSPATTATAVTQNTTSQNSTSTGDVAVSQSDSNTVVPIQPAPTQPSSPKSGLSGKPTDGNSGKQSSSTAVVSVTAEAQSNIEIGQTDQITLHAYNSQGEPVNLNSHRVSYEIIQGVTGGANVSSQGLFTVTISSIYMVRTYVDGVMANDVTINVGPKTHPYKLDITVSNNLIAGSSEYSILMVQVVDCNGHDVEGATVTLADANPSLVHMDRTQGTTDVNGIITAHLTATGSAISPHTVEITATTSGNEQASIPVIVNDTPAKIVVESIPKQLYGYTDSNLVVKVVDAEGNVLPGIGVMPKVTGGGSVALNQSIFKADSSGNITIPLYQCASGPAQVQLTVPGSDVTWSGTIQ